jgi:U3 small nucleolar RNA-associated protein 3
MNSDSEEEFRQEREEIRFSESGSESEKEEQVFDINSDSEDEGILEQFKLHNRTHAVEQQESEESEEDWGTKNDYYLNEEEDSDNSDEEKEALKIQQKQLEDLNEDDFVSNLKFKPKITQKQKNKNITFYKNEVKKYEGVQNQLVSLYLLNISFYFAVESTMDCTNHPVLTTLEEIRGLLQKYEDLGLGMNDENTADLSGEDISDDESIGAEEIERRMLEQSDSESINAEEDEQDFNDNESGIDPTMFEQDSDHEQFSNEDSDSAEILTESTGFPIEEYVPIKPKRHTKKQDTFGESENLDLDLDDKRKRKKSLRFHANRVEKVFSN